MRLTLQTFLTLDGVMQAPGGSDEDIEGGFAHGGWSFPYGDEDFGTAMGGWLEKAEAFLLGRQTYDIFASYWPKVTDPDNLAATKLNGLPKYVASTTLRDPAWAQTTVLGPDVVSEVRALKDKPGKELQVHGSGALAQTLIEADLIDEYRLLTFPVLIGANSGKRLFRDRDKGAALTLTNSTTTSAGVIIATYEPAGPAKYGSYTLDED
jgi:dihydrofolate reductase